MSLAVKAAKAWGVPPTTILRGADAGWTHTDRVLAVAATLAEEMRCPGCGQPKHESWNPDSEGWYEDRSATCQGCRVLELDSSKQPPPGQKRWVVDTRPLDVELTPWQPA